MSKQLLPNELAEIVTGLLMAPALLGELDDSSDHKDFMAAIAGVVTDFCGGNVDHVEDEAFSESYLTDDFHSPQVIITPSESLPSLNNNVWSLHDTDAWADKSAGDFKIESGIAPTPQVIADTLQAIQGLLPDKALKDNQDVHLTANLVDWALASKTDVVVPEDRKPYSSEIQLGNQSSFEIHNDNGESRLAVHIEISKGVPAIRLGANGSELLHIHAAQGGLVLTPDSADVSISSADADRHSFHEYTSILVKHVCLPSTITTGSA